MQCLVCLAPGCMKMRGILPVFDMTVETVMPFVKLFPTFRWLT